MATLSIVLPAYNEAEGIREVIQRILAVCASLHRQVPQVADVELIVINDGSNDHTAQIVGSFSQVRLLNHARNRGYGAALKTGFAAAKGDYIAFLDADGTYPPEQIPALLGVAVKTDADMVIGSRMLGQRSRMPLLRKVGNRLYALLLSWIAGRFISDTASGLRIFKREILPVIQPLPDGLNLTPAMATLAVHEGLHVIEIPIPYDERVGRSKLGIVKDGFRFLFTILGITQTYNPLKVYGAIGIVMLLVGLLLGIEPVKHYLEFREVPDHAIYRLFTILVLGTAGLSFITFGVSANYVLSIVRGRPVDTSIIGKVLSPNLVKHFNSLGILFVVSAILLNANTIFEYISTAHITVHWSYILTGAFLFLVGVQLVLASGMMTIFDALNLQVAFSNARTTRDRLDRQPRTANESSPVR